MNVLGAGHLTHHTSTIMPSCPEDCAASSLWRMVVVLLSSVILLEGAFSCLSLPCQDVQSDSPVLLELTLPSHDWGVSAKPP
jgi:hypothetical protein